MNVLMTLHYVCGLGLVAILALHSLDRRWNGWVRLVFSFAGGLLLSLGLFAFFLHGADGCWPWSPGEVFHRPGLTLCPGQKLRFLLPLQPGVPV